jgi:C1A family cysteine protease
MIKEGIMYQAYPLLRLEGGEIRVGTGWLPPLPDLRDYNETVGDIPEMAGKLGIPLDESRDLPESTDWRSYCSKVEHQGRLGSCTAHAAVGAAEYYQRRAFNEHIDGSRLFVYKATRNLMGVTGDTGAWLRNTMGALVTCGVAPERYWPYRVEDFDLEPPSFVYSVAEEFEALKYFSHDPLRVDRAPEEVLERVKAYLAAGIPSMFGFYGFGSFEDTDREGGIPFPCPEERALWGHAVMAVGYDDRLQVTNTRCGLQTEGALLIRNSWGMDWGEAGYGWLPYRYVLEGYARDFWSLISMSWVNTREFGI